MRVGIVVPANISYAPYVSIYTKMLDNNNISYDIISWNREGLKEEGIQYPLQLASRNPIVLVLAYLRFSLFAKRHIKESKYDKLIIFTPQAAIFASRFLKIYYKDKYIFDYRDLSIEQKAFFKRPFVRVLKNSFMNVVSSPGFLKYLPSNYKYYLSHNFNVEELRLALESEDESLNYIDESSSVIDVLTIGGIRDYESNVQVIEHLANIEGINMRFIGRGSAAPALEEYANSINATNISFEGFYPKEKEKTYVNDCTFLNIFYPRKPSHDTALSNRFYNSLIYKRPMITTMDTIQGDYASKYKVGIAIEDCRELDIQMRQFLNNMDVESYVNNCNMLLTEFLTDYNTWEGQIRKFLEID